MVESVMVGRRDKFDDWLWENTELAFNQHFMDILSQERAKATLDNGIKMEIWASSSINSN